MIADPLLEHPARPDLDAANEIDARVGVALSRARVASGLSTEEIARMAQMNPLARAQCEAARDVSLQWRSFS